VRRVLVTGATGFVGKRLLAALRGQAVQVRATSRSAPPQHADVEWVRCDIAQRADLMRAMEGVDVAYFLVHGMGGGQHDYADGEARAARLFREVAAEQGVNRIIYLGGVAPQGAPSVHLRSRLDVGEVLRGGTVPALELRASMIIGAGSASWQIVRDLSLRLPVMLLPSWTRSTTCPVDIGDVITALIGGLEVPLERSAWFDIPGPEVLSGSALMMRLAWLQGRHVPSVNVPFLSVSLSSWWLRLVTRADFSLARELVLGFTSDLLPKDDRYWAMIEAPPRLRFDAAARRALAEEPFDWSVRGLTGSLEESVVGIVGRRLARR
jgi:uncharacterized protein YbjT (DUF2867 family)